jgi:hypothetical protein
MSENPPDDNEDVKLEQIFRKMKSKLGSYYPIHFFLILVPKEQKQLSFTFAEISKILTFDLPSSAFKHQAWWANTKSHPHAKAWMDSGWEVDDVYLPTETVVFCRKGSWPVADIPKFVKNLLNHKHMKGIPDCQTLAEWIRFCKQVGWYFEGTVLFEKGGLRLDVLNESQRVEVEEDYGICRKKLDGNKLTNPFYPKEANNRSRETT